MSLADADDPALGVQLDDISQEIRPMAAAGGEQGRVRQCDWGHRQSGDRERGVPPRECIGRTERAGASGQHHTECPSQTVATMCVHCFTPRCRWGGAAPPRACSGTIRPSSRHIDSLMSMSRTFIGGCSVPARDRLMRLFEASDRRDDAARSARGAIGEQAPISAETATHHPFGSSSNCCNRAPSGGGKRAGQVASIRPTPIMSRR